MSAEVSSRVKGYVYPTKRVIHRGAGKDAPENTKEAVAYGFEKYNSRAVEFDVQLSSDNVPILIHDAKLGRTVKSELSVADILASDLLAMDAGAWHSIPYVGAKVPLYEDIVGYCRTNSIWMNVEVKGDFSNIEQLRNIGRTVSLLTKKLFKEELSEVPPNYKQIPMISSFSVEALQEVLKVAPEIPRALLVRGLGSEEGFFKSVKHVLEALGQVEATACHINEVGLTRSDVEALLAEGYTVMCYTVNCPKRCMELEMYGVHSICTDVFSLGIEQPTAVVSIM